MHVDSFQHIGTRKVQQDRFFSHPDNSVFAVCDGVGGSQDGGLAADQVIQSIKERYQKKDTPFSPNQLKEILLAASNDLVGYAKKNDVGTIATTLAMIAFEGTTAISCHIGDSKIFHIQSRNKYWYSKDHSVVQELFDSGVLSSEDEMLHHPMRNRITKALTSKEVLNKNEVKINLHRNIQQGDIFILCTDGALETFTPSNVVELFTNTDITLESRWDYFKENCLLNSKDNCTCIIILV